ncbi:hypothetical protein D3C73_1096480 [compost metagenome]
MRGREGVVDVEVAQFRQLGGEGRVVLLLAFVEADVLEQQYAAGVEIGDHRLGFVAHAVVGEAHGAVQQQLQRLDHGAQAHRRHALALGPVEVGQQHHLGAGFAQAVDGRQGRLQPGVVGDVPVLHRHVEVHANQGGLAGQVGNVVEGAEGHGISLFFLLPSWEKVVRGASRMRGR